MFGFLPKVNYTVLFKISIIFTQILFWTQSPLYCTFHIAITDDPQIFFIDFLLCMNLQKPPN